MSALWLVAPQRRPVVLHLRALMEHLRYRRSVPCLSSPVDFNAVPIVQRLVAAFRMVFALRYSRDNNPDKPLTPAVPFRRNCGAETGEVSPFSIQSASSASKGITKWSALISFRTRSISHLFLAQNLR